MPKIIQPKRLNKNITVDEYWQIRNKLKSVKKSLPVQAYRQEEVANRFRYLKPTQQAKLFNPLNYFFKRSTTTQQDDQQYQEHFKDQQSTNTHEYLSSVRYRVSGPLVPIKKLVFGLKSIIYNHEKILSTLVSHLECEDAWPIMQAVIKDTKEISFDFWMKQGLRKLAYQNQDENGQSESIYLNFFHQVRFQTLFDTLSIFMQANYDQIMSNIKQFFTLMNTNFFNHQNKYIRKFSMKSVSYIINNLSLQDNLSLIFGIVVSGAVDQEDIPIGQLLLNRHKAVKGCLSSVEINNVVETLKQLPLFVNKSFDEAEMEDQTSNSQNKLRQQFKEQLKKNIDEIIVVYIAGIMDLLDTKFGRTDQAQGNNGILFDLNYCIRAFISLQEKSQSRITELTLVKAFRKYLEDCDEKRFLTHNAKHQSYINETFQLILGYLQNATLKIVDQNQVNENAQAIGQEIGTLLGLAFKICPKESVKFLISKGIIHYCKLLDAEESLELCRQIYGSQISLLDSQQNKSLGEFLLITFSKFIKSYFETISSEKDTQLSELLYIIYMTLKRIGFTNAVNLSYLGLDKLKLVEKVGSITEVSEFIVFCKLATLLNIASQNDQLFSQNFSASVKKTFQQLIQPFESSLHSIINSETKTEQTESIFSYSNHIKNLLRYSHHEVEWVNIAFNLEECYKELLKRLTVGKAQAQKEKWVWQELSLSRVIEVDEKYSLEDIFVHSMGLLQSRNRLGRKAILERILSLWGQSHSQQLKAVIQRLFTIDSEDVLIENQREVKKQFVQLELDLSSIKPTEPMDQQLVKLMANWILGFSFTGFKLLNQSIVTFMTSLFESFPNECSQILFPFLSYYIYRHSRQFEYDMNQNEVFVLRTPKNVEKQLADLKSREEFYSLMKEDFNIHNQNTIEWIGLERIAQAIGKARKFKNNAEVKVVSEQYLREYFDVEFFRKQNVLSAYSLGQQQPNSHLILQPKTRFLSVVLKLCPDTFLPPYECLHYVVPEYFNLSSINNIKKNRWEALWVKKLKGMKSKEQISDTVNTAIDLEKMSMPEQEVYVHFLWKQLLEANQHKRRTIFEHIRDRVPEIIPYFFNNILYKQMLFVKNPDVQFQSIQKNPELIEEFKQKLSFQNKKTLLNMMYLLKAMIVVFKNFLRNSSHMQNVVVVLRCLIQLVYLKVDKEVQEENQEHVEEAEQEEQEGEREQQKEEREEKDAFTLYKPHRKQLYKVLTEVFTHYSLEYEQAEQILSDLSVSYLGVNANDNSQSQRIFSKLAYASVNSVPGILILLKVISQQPFYHHLLIKFGILNLVASIVDISDKQQQEDNKLQMQEEKKEIRKKQSNPHAIITCLDILTNILGVDENSKVIQENKQEIYLKSHWHKWTSSLQHLLISINHYFLYSRNLSEKTQNSNSSHAELDYYTNENKQNLKSIQNNKNRSKKEHPHHDNQGKNLDAMWLIVGKVVALSKNDPRPQEEINANRIHFGIQWQQIFWNEINKVVKIKLFKEKQFSKLFTIIQISLVYFDQQLAVSKSTSSSKKLDIETFLCKIISVLPHINQLSERVKLTTMINKGIEGTCKREKLRLIDQIALKTVTGINAIKRTGLNVEIDFEQFFGCITEYCQHNIQLNKTEGEMVNENQGDTKEELNLLSHQYIIYNLLPYLTSEELSVRKAVREALNSFLIKISVHLKDSEAETLKVFNSIFRLLIDQLKRNEIDSVFWSILGCMGLFIRFEVKFTERFEKVFDNSLLYQGMFAPLVRIDSKELTFESEHEEDFFHMITSISQGNKMKALRMLKESCSKLKGYGMQEKFKQEEKGCCLPHPIPLLLSTLQHLVLPIKHFNNQHYYNIQGNLTSTLTHISLQVYEVIIAFARDSLVKKELKRLSTKIKFNQSMKANQDTVKGNILVIKIISSIVEGIDTLPKCTGNIKKHITDHGFDDFHSKLIVNARKLNQDEQSDQSQEEEENGKKKRVEFTSNLEELQPQEAVNRNFMLFDRKLMAMEEKEKQEQQLLNQSQQKSQLKSQQKAQSQSSLVSFLKLHILIPFKLMLFYENKTTKDAKEEEDKSRMMISVAITKLVIKFPMEMFLFEFQKILSKICRLLKKKKQDVRQNARKSLCQIAKIVGPEMLYAIVLELKFHLRDNFQKHIFNYTVYQIIQSLSPLGQGQLDYCLPLILPMVIDELFGQSNQEKKMVEANQVPVLNMETKKKKGNELLVLISKQISMDRIRYLIEYLEKFLKDFLNSEANLSKYETVINNLTNGLGHNEQFCNQENAPFFGEILCNSMYELRKEIKIYNFEEEKNQVIPETSIKINTQKIKKVGKQTLMLQQEAGRNGSIFKKMSKQVYQKRNKEIMINCLVQFYLALGSLLIKKQVISLKTLQENKHLTDNFIKIMQFVFECMDHRDNRIVCKSMRLLHQALIINYERSTSTELKESTKSLRKKVSRKILLFCEKLTSSDAQLLKQSFVILIDLFTQVTITKEFLPSIIAIIKLHTNNQNEQANIPEPYRLLKLIIYKLPECIYDPLIYQMYELIRINVVNSSIRDIRDVCRQIASTYVRSKEFLSTGLQLGSTHKDTAHKGKSKPHHHERNIEHQYSEKIKKELNFFLSNVDCRMEQNQLLILEIIEEWISNRTKQEVQEVSELILLTLSTSLINGNDCVEKINKIIVEILKLIDKSKIYEILEKTLVWIAQDREKSMIRECGYFLLYSIIQSKTIQIGNNVVKTQYLLKDGPTSLLSSISTLLGQEIEVLTDYLIARKNQNQSKNLQNKEWSSVLDAIEVEESNPYISDNRILQYCVDLLTYLAEEGVYQQKLKEKQIVAKVWKLLKIPKTNICVKSIKFFEKIKTLYVHLSSSKQLTEDHLKHAKKQQQTKQIKKQEQSKLPFNLKSTIATLINNQIPKDSINDILKKFISQPQTGEKCYIELFELLLSFLTKLVTKFKFMQVKAETIYHLLNHCIISDQEKRQLIFSNEQLQLKVIDALGKVSRNEFVSLQCKTINEDSVNLVKEIVGVSEFYRKLTKLQSERRQKKTEQKATLARLAITDQKAYIDAKKKKIKVQ